MSTSPDAEWPIDDDLVRRLLSTQCPDLSHLPLAHYTHGWDNEMYRLGTQLLVRVPRRERSAPLMRHEIAWLPTLADHMPVYTPQPVFAGEPGPDYPWAWSIVPFVDGIRATEVPRTERTPAAEALADFLHCLHLPAPLGAPENPVRGGSLDQPAYAERAAERLGTQRDRGALQARWDAWSAAPEWHGHDLWLHGDLHPLNLLLDDERRLLGVIDWGDMTSGDPACDLSTAWLTFEGPGRAAFIERASDNSAYDAHVWTRAKAWALYLALIFATSSDDAPPLREVGEQTLASLLEEPLAD